VDERGEKRAEQAQSKAQDAEYVTMDSGRRSREGVWGCAVGKGGGENRRREVMGYLTELLGNEQECHSIMVGRGGL
jgi:hypothetical protein